MKGGAKLQVIIRASDYNFSTMKPTYIAKAGDRVPKGVSLTSYKTFRDARYAGSFEGQTTVGIGTRAKLPFRVVQSGNLIIVDVAHKW